MSVAAPEGIDFFARRRRALGVRNLDDQYAPFDDVFVPSLMLSRKARSGSTPTFKGTPGLRLEPLITSPQEEQCQSEKPQSRNRRRLGVRGSTTGTPSSDVPSTPSTAMASAATPSCGIFTPSSRDVFTPEANIRIQGWRKGEEIGCGAFGRVRKAQNKATGQIFAVKEARIRDGEEKHFENLQRELEICKGLRHRHIVSCLGHEYHSENQTMFIYLEYVAGGSLRHMLNEFGPLTGKLLQKATRGVLKGLTYLHTHDPPVVHRDLKGANVLVDLNYCVKLADFGCSKCDVNTQTFTTYGSILWMAPEVLQGAGSGRMADIWSFGCLFIEMLTAADPWGKAAFDNPMQAIFAIAASERIPPFPETLTDVSRDFLSACLRRLPAERPTAVQLLKHQLIQDGCRSASRPTSRETY